MDERTEALRDLFVDVTDEETVTESQVADRGSLIDADDADVPARVDDVIERMRKEYTFVTDRSPEELRAVVLGFFDGEDDETIADRLGVDAETVFDARMDLHLLKDDDTDLPVDFERIRADSDADTATLAAELAADTAAVERARRVLETQAAIRRVSHRFQSEFEDAIPDAALAVQLTAVALEDGLQEAAEDIETDTQF